MFGERRIQKFEWVYIFGHRSISDMYKKYLTEQIEYLICECGVDTFYVGNQGNYDNMVLNVLRKIKIKYSNIQYFVVLAYMPGVKNVKKKDVIDYQETIYPEGLEKVPVRFAIPWRNKWMVHQSEYVIACVRGFSGGAAQFVKYAVNQKKTVINLIDLMSK